ncbi:MAG TPA: LLM class flavin-dependent oxidoreductase [Solirubrobacteraceae bacterium]|nr:LLM class flavin-dependent oxidoreductase [Solirubrobacteraceae bacterium]
MPSELRIGVLDQSPIAMGSTGAQALRDTLDLARLADERGFHRYWVAEHHGGPMLAGTSPEALIGPIAATTSRIRVGSGGVMLPHYSPFKVAEAFSVLSGLFPGRIDLGLGRTDGTDDAVTAFALQRDRNHPAPDDFPEQLGELLTYIDQPLPEGHLFAHLPALLPGRPEVPEPWLLGSSAQSAVWAAQLGLPYAFGDFINPGGGIDVVNLYRERFVASERLAEPRVLVAVWALCADSDEEAERLSAPGRMVRLLARRGKVTPVPPVDTALRFIERQALAGPERIALGKRMLHGSPATVCSALRDLAAAYGSDELLVVSVTHEHETRRRSYDLLAEAFALSAAPAPAPAQR